mmetsp:Transcript_11404/g.22617  ORF Transcript_11404/g.22617 Transcript_11404/m.22617 type:complete len:407 (-) Transcript_11404:253-1473(-)
MSHHPLLLIVLLLLHALFVSPADSNYTITDINVPGIPGDKAPDASASFVNNCPSDDPEYDFMKEIHSLLRFYWNLPEEATAAAMLRGSIEGGYLSFGIASPERPGLMIGGHAIVGSPSIVPQIAWYALTGYAERDVNPMFSAEIRSTLRDAELTQNSDGRLAMHFKLHLGFTGTNLIDANSTNSFIWAEGKSETLGYHVRHGSFIHSFEECLGKMEVPIQKQMVNPVLVWIAHGVTSLIAWVLLSPGAVLVSRFRNRMKVGSWLTIHRRMNVSAIVLGLVSFGIALWKKNRNPYGYMVGNIAHFSIGIVLTGGVLLQGIIGTYFRPPNPPLGNEKSQKRIMWEYFHRYFGTALLLLAAIQCIIGVWLFEKIYSSNVMFVLSVVCVLVLIMFGLGLKFVKIPSRCGV